MDTTATYDESLDSAELAFQRLYGPWQPMTPREAKQLLDPLGLDWWVVGGWAIEAFTGTARHHEDLDVAMWWDDLAAIRAGLSGRLHLWGVGPDGMRPVDDERPQLPPGASQLWLRAHALAPWRIDILLHARRDGRWVSRRDQAWTEDLADVVWQRDGIRYMRPHLVLAHKAKGDRAKDRADLEATLPLLDGEELRWLADWLAARAPEHSWLPLVRSAVSLSRHG